LYFCFQSLAEFWLSKKANTRMIKLEYILTTKYSWYRSKTDIFSSRVLIFMK
jgi:hypothetical protein